MNVTNLTDSNWTRWHALEPHPKFQQFWFERVDIDFWYDFGEAYTIPIICLVIATYLLGIWWLKGYMEARPPLHLRWALVVWNIVVALFSITIFLRLAPEVWAIWRNHQGFYESVCLRTGLHMSSVFWAIVLCWFKPFLMLDTVFLILRKKHVDAVHVIHHTLAVILTPNMVFFSEPILRWYGLANLLVHSIDYPLLALTAMRIPVPKSRQIMAILEVLQLLFLLSISGYAAILRVSGTYCMRHPKSVVLLCGVVLVILVFLTATLLSKEYWKRGKKQPRGDAASIPTERKTQ